MPTLPPVLRRGALRVLLAGAVVASTLALTAEPSAAHTPHDDVYDIAASPRFATDRTLLSASRGLLLRSTDGGATWSRLVRGLDPRAQFFAVGYAGTSGEDAYAVAGDAAFRSRDGGDSWTRIYTQDGSDRDLHVLATSPVATAAAVVSSLANGALITSDGGQAWRSLGASSAAVTSVSYAPASAQVIVAGDANGALHVTRDGGLTWTHQSLGSVGPVSSIALSPSFATDGLALIGTDAGGVLRWDADTRQVTPVNSGLTDPRVTSIAYSAGYPDDDTVFASTWNTGTFRSTDGGSTWSPVTAGLRKDRQADEPQFLRPHFGKVVTAMSDSAGDEPVVHLASFTGVYTSVDQGGSWHQRVTQSPSIVVGMAVSPSYATDHRVAVTTYVNSAFTSSDGGDTWAPSNLGLAYPNYWASGADRYLHSFAVDISPPVGGRSWLFTASDTGVFRSSNGGASWRLTPIPGYANPRVATTSVAPRVFVSPQFATDRTVFMVDTGAGDVYRSTDEGASFQLISHIEQPSGVHCLRAAPTFAVDHRLLACTGIGVYQSTDMGVTWTVGARLTLADLAVTVNGSTETWFGATSSGLYRSTDRGQSWSAVRLPAPAPATPPIPAVAASPPSGGPATVLVSTKGSGLFRSTDGGATFAPTGAGLLAANEQLDTYNFRNTGTPIIFSPSFTTDRTVFGASHDRVLRSTDGGTTWQVLPVPKATHGPVFPVVPVAPTIGTPARGNGRISVAFTPPPDSGTPILHFDAVCRSSNGGVTARATGQASPIVVRPLTNGVSYTCRVTATNGLGTSPPSAASSVVVPATVPAAPTVTAAVAGHLQATIAWSPPASNGGERITGYQVTPFIGLAPQPPITFPSAATSQVVSGLTDGVTYRFAVAAINAVGTGPVSRVSPPVTPAPVPPTPARPTATGLAGSASVTWTAPASDGTPAITGYVITPYVGYFPLRPIVVDRPVTTQVVSGLIAGTTYRFSVAAVNTAGTGLPSRVSNPATPR